MQNESIRFFGQFTTYLGMYLFGFMVQTTPRPDNGTIKSAGWNIADELRAGVTVGVAASALGEADPTGFGFASFRR
jgi:hypothetical protein